jgi:hypothetical protein
MARSEVNFIYDAANAFRAPAQAAVVASGVIGTKALDKLVNVRPSSQRNKLGAESYKVVLVVESIVTGGVVGETYTFRLDSGAEGAATTAIQSIVVAAPGQYVMEIDAATLEKLDAAHEVLELNLTVAGTAPSIRFAAWLL